MAKGRDETKNKNELEVGSGWLFTTSTITTIARAEQIRNTHVCVPKRWGMNLWICCCWLLCRPRNTRVLRTAAAYACRLNIENEMKRQFLGFTHTYFYSKEEVPVCHQSWPELIVCNAPEVLWTSRWSWHHKQYCITWKLFDNIIDEFATFICIFCFT